MRRFIAFSCLTLMAVQGCATKRAESAATVVPPAKMRDLIRQDQDRLGGVDSPRHQGRTYLGVDVTGENPFMAFGHVIWAVPARLIRFASGETPVKWAVAMEDTRSADNRREGIMHLVENRFARKDPYTKRYEQIGQRDPEYLVRSAAMRALNYSRSREGAELFVAALDDGEVLVRLEAAKGLANLPVEKAMPRLIALLQKDESRDVRIACADALRNYKTIDVARALTAVMTDRDFGVSWQARESLRLMTGHDFRYDEQAWLGYLASASKPFV